MSSILNWIASLFWKKPEKLITMSEVYETNHKKFNVLDLKEKMGPTDYLDFIEEDEVSDSVMVGIDKYDREFIVIKFVVTKKDGTTIDCFQTFFRRYTDKNNHGWMGAGHYGLQLFDTSGFMNQYQIKVIDDLLKIGQFTVPSGVDIHEYKFEYLRANFSDILSPIKIELKK